MRGNQQPLDTVHEARKSRGVRRFLQIVLVLLLLGTGGTMWYLYRKGFTKPWREWLVEELRRRGVEVAFSKLIVEPFRGLVAKDVKIFQNASRKQVLAKVDEIVVEANYARAARGEPFLDALTLVDASLELPLDPKYPSGPALKVEKLSTRLHLPPRQLFVARLEAEVSGIRVKAAGQLANPFEGPTAAPAPSKPAGPNPWLRVVEELRKIRYDRAAPELNLRFSGDRLRPETLVVEAELRAERARYANYRLESLAVSASWQNQALVVSRFEARDAVGQLHLAASYQATTGQAECRVRSGINMPAFLRAVKPDIDFGEFKFQSVPELEVTATATLPRRDRQHGDLPLQFQVLGHARVGRCQYGKTPLERVNGDFSCDGIGEFKPRRWALRDLHIRHADGGELRGDAQQTFNLAGEGDFRLGLESTLNPETLAPLLQAQFKPVAARLEQFRFHEAPRLKLSARGPSHLDCAASGEVVLGKTTYRGVEALGGKANLRYNGRVLSVDDFTLRRAEGTGTGSVAFDFESGLAHIRDVKCAMFPIEAILWVDPDLVSDLRPYRIAKRPPNVVVNGLADMRRPPLRTRLDIAVDAPTLEYTLFGKDLHFTGVTARMAFTESLLTMTNVQAELFGGTLRGEATISIRKGKPGHTAHVEFDGVDFTKLTKLYFDYNESQGKLHGTYDFTGAGDDGRVMRGHGGITVMEGQVFAIPFLGPFSGFLNDLVPGMGYQKARRASATFTVDEGVIATKDFVIVGRGFSMIGDGEIGFLDDRLDFDMRVNAQGLPGVVLFPVSKLLEYETRGKFSEPAWRLKIVPRFGPANRAERGKEHERPREPERSKEPAERAREPERVKEPERAKEPERVRAR